jgi:hypothetical protein
MYRVCRGVQTGPPFKMEPGECRRSMTLGSGHDFAYLFTAHVAVAPHAMHDP